MASIQPVNSNLTNPDFNSLFSAIGGNSLAFGSVFTQAMNQAKTPANAAKIQWLQAEYSDLTDLSNLGSGSSAGLGLGDLFGAGGALSLPSWAGKEEQLLGNDPVIQQLMNVQQQASFALQSQFNQNLADFGSSGSSVNSLI
jgi:hypothetical protein